MEHNRNQKLLMIIALVLSIASLSIGFAAFSVSLNISSQASVSPSSDTFSVKFSTSKDSLIVNEVEPSYMPPGISVSAGVIDNSTNPTIKGLSAIFTSPGQYAEYTFYARNEGEYTAYLNNINFLGSKTCKAETGTTDSLVQSACESINITATIGNTTYTETTPITGHTLNKKTGEEIKVRLEYASNGTTVDGAFSITFPKVAFVYSTLDDSSIKPTVKVVKLESGDLNTPGSIVSIENERFYVFGQEDGNVKLLSMYNLYVGGFEQDKSIIAYGSEATGIQDATMLGYVYGKSPSQGVTFFSTTDRTGHKSDYKGSLVEEYVNNYKLYLEGLGARINSARLITKNELEFLGCSEVDGSCIGAPEWVSATSYWTGTSDGYSNIWAVYGRAYSPYFQSTNYSYRDLGVRPVIEIPVSEF